MDPVTAGSLAMIALAAVVAFSLTRTVAPYGRHARPGWGPTVPSRVGWVLMESPSVVLYAWLARHGSLVFAAIWLSHYVWRAWIYPFRTPPGRPMPASVALMAFCFNLLNATLNASIPAPPPSWWADPRFLVGIAVFYAGMGLNHDADARLRRLRRSTDGYAIPTGGAFQWVSCPNYLGEIVEWFGWALLTWSLPGLAFAIFTAANLAPRAYSHHAWYRRTFPDYPPERTALIPGLGR